MLGKGDAPDRCTALRSVAGCQGASERAPLPGGAARAGRPGEGQAYSVLLNSSRLGVPDGLLLITLVVALLMIQLWTVPLEASP